MRGALDRLTYANVVATLALFIAVAGGSAAALSGKNSVKHDDLANNVVHSPEIKKGSVKSSDIANGKIKAADLKDGSVGPDTLDAVPAARIEGGGDVLANDSFVALTEMSDAVGDSYDPFDMWDPSEPARLTVPIDGIYMATGTVAFANDDTATPGLPNDNGYRLVQVSADGETQRQVVAPNRFNAETQYVSTTNVARLEAGKFITLNAAQGNEDASSNTVVTAKLTATWIAPLP